MTDTQKKLYRFILESFRDKGRAPSIREMCAAMGWASPNACGYHLDALARRGLIEVKDDGKHTAIRVRRISAAIKNAALILLHVENQ